MSGRRLAVAAYVALGVVWGSNFVFMKLAAPHISAGQTTLLRLVFGVVPILLFALATGAVRRWHLRHAHHFAVQAVLAAGFYYYAYAEGASRLDSGVAGVLSGTIPIFAAIGALLVFRTEPITARKTVGVTVGAAGVVVLAQPWAASGIAPAGVLWMLAGSASLGLSFGYAGRFITPLGIPAAASSSYQMLIAAVGLTAVTDLDGVAAIADDNDALAGVVLGLGVLGTGLAFMFYYVAVDGLGAVTASTASYIAPVVALGIGFGMLGEQLRPVTVGAVVLILGAATVAQLPARRSPDASTAPPAAEPSGF